MKTMHLTNAWSETSGGIATFYRALMDAANRRQHEMVMVVPGARDRERLVGDYVRIYEIEAPPARLNSVYRMIYPNQFLKPGGKLREILRLEAPDLVEINDKYTLNYLGPLLRQGLLPEIKFRPVMVGLTCERMDVNFRTYLSAGAAGRKFCSLYMRYIYFPFFDQHIAVSMETAGELRTASKGHAIPRGVFQLPMGVDCSSFSPKHRSAGDRESLLSKIGAVDGPMLLLYVGRLAPEKNLPLLLDTMEALLGSGQDYRLLIAGDGISRVSFLEEAQRRVGSRVHWLGYIKDREELAKLYANCDFFLHPNPREPFGIAPLEAMASGTVLVAPNSGGITAYASSGNAALCEPTGAAFARAIESLVSDGQKREDVIQAAFKTAQEFSWEAATDRYLNLYEELHAMSLGKVTLDQLSPEFVSEPPSRTRAKSMKSAADLASAVYSYFSKDTRSQPPAPHWTKAERISPDDRGSVEA